MWLIRRGQGEKEVLRRLIDIVIIFLCWLKRNRKVKPGPEVVKVNLGSGLQVAPGWLNVDASLNAMFGGWPRLLTGIIYRLSGAKNHYSQEKYCELLENNTFVHHRLEYGIPFPDESVDYLYFSNALEHLYRVDGLDVIKDTHRVLKKGGVLRICVPNLEYIMNYYHMGEKRRFLYYFFNDQPGGHLNFHHYMYDFELLSQLCQEAGFLKIERCSFQEGQTPDIEFLDINKDITLFVEVKK